MKNVPALRFSEFTGNWKEEKLRNILSEKITNGIMIDNATLVSDKSTHFIVQLSDIYQADCYINSEKLSGISFSGKEQILKTGDVVINRVSIKPTGVGKVVLFDKLSEEKLTLFESNMFRIRLDKQYTLDSYFYYFSNTTSYIKQKLALAKVTNQASLSQADIGFIDIQFPRIKEQQKIATFLSAVDKKLGHLCRKHALLESYKRGVMQKIFSQEFRFKQDDGTDFPDWEEKQLGDYINNYRLGGNYSNSGKSTDFPLIKMGNLGRGKINLRKIEYITENEDVDDIDRLREGDLLFNTRNTLDLVGKVSIWKNELPVAYYNSNLMKMGFENNYFMNYRFNSFAGIKSLRRIATGTTSVAAIYTKDLLKIKFWIPVLEEQQKIANFLSTLDKKLEAVQKQINQTKTFKKGLLQKMFV